jgi:crossover junction endodeoxyribonuclease RuvC
MSETGLPALRILGVDPGLRVTGFGVIEKVGSRLRYLASGCIRTTIGDSLPIRLGTIHTGLRELVAQHRPDEAATEIVFVNVNPQSTLLLGQARGAAISALVSSGLAVAEYTALQVKQAVVGNGHADKVQVQHMVRHLLSLPSDARCRMPPMRSPAPSRTRTADKDSGALAGRWPSGARRPIDSEEGRRPERGG